MRSRTPPIRSGFCAKSGACWPAAAAFAGGGAEIGAGCGRAWTTTPPASRPYSRPQLTHLLRETCSSRAGGLGRSALRAAGRTRLVLALRRRLGARRVHHFGAVCRRAYRRYGDQAGLSRNPDPARAACRLVPNSVAAGAGADARRGSLAIRQPARRLVVGLSKNTIPTARPGESRSSAASGANLAWPRLGFPLEFTPDPRSGAGKSSGSDPIAATARRRGGGSIGAGQFGERLSKRWRSRARRPAPI